MPPEELVVFLESWRKQGRHRLYVKAADGVQVGYLDLVSGEVHAAMADWEPLLGRLLPHYVKGDTPGIAATDMSTAAMGALRRFLASVLGPLREAPPQRTILAAYRWRGHGKNRLYLHRIDADGVKSTLGWFDIDHGRYSCDEPGTGPILSYCGEQYRSFSRLPG